MAQSKRVALAAALAIGDERWRAPPLAALAPQLRSKALERGLDAALAIIGDRHRAEALVAFLPMAPDRAAVLCNARKAIADHLLKNLSSATRSDVLWFCAEEKLFAPPLLDQDTLAAIAGHIVEVCQEWRWV